MLALLFLAASVAAATTPAAMVDKDKKILPLFEDPMIPHNIPDTRMALRAWCLDDCHHHVLDKPVMIAVRSSEFKWDVHFLPLGLNHMTKSATTAPIKDMLTTKGMVGIISPMSRFPFELFPGMLDTDLLIPEHHSKLSFMYKEAPILVVMPEEEFKKFNEKRGYTPVADLGIDDLGFTVIKDFAQMYRNNPVKTIDSAPGIYYLVPTVTTGAQSLMPTTSGVVPLTSSEYMRYIAAGRPYTNPALSKSFTFY